MQTPELWPACAGRSLAGELSTVPAHATVALTLRFLCDDIKAMYSEAAQADGVPPSSRQIDAWFWSSDDSRPTVDSAAIDGPCRARIMR